MSIIISSPIEQNVVNVGDELTAGQLAALQNAQGASATNPCLTRTNTFNTADTAVRITQDGAGDAFRVEDVTNDTSPFVITSDGRVGVGRSPTSTYALDVAGNFLTAASTVSFLVAGSQVLINSTSGSDTFRINNTGTGNSFVVEDDTSPDSTPFVINNIGSVGIGISNPTSKLHINGGANISTNSSILPVLQISQTGTASVASFTNTATATEDCVRITNLGTGNSFVVEDSTNPDASPFVINADGNIGIGRLPTTRKVEMLGSFAVTGSTVFENNVASSTNSFEFTNVNTGNSGIAFLIENRGSGNSFVVRDEASDTTPFVIAANGDVTLGGSLTLAAGSLNLSVGAQTYPHELTFIVGGVTYRVPARAI